MEPLETTSTDRDERSVVYINNFAAEGIGGGEKHLLAIANAAREAGWRPTIVCLPGSGLAAAAESEGLATVGVPLMRRFVPATVLRLRRVLRELHPDVVHTHGFFVNNVGRVAARLARAPVVVSTVHCEPDSSTRFDASTRAGLTQRLRDAVDNVTSRCADAIIAVAQVIAAELENQGIEAGKIRVIYNGIVLPDRDLEEAEAGEAAQSLPAGCLVGTVGRLEPVKGLDYLLEAAKRVCDARPDVRFVVTGDGPIRRELEQRIEALGLADRVTMTGYVEGTTALVAKMDVYVLPSLSEGLNMSLLEALALERPTIATSAGGNGEVILNRRTGLLVPPRDVEALTGAIEWMLDNPEPARRLGEAGRHRVAEVFSQEKMCAETLALYDELLAISSERSERRRRSERG